MNSKQLNIMNNLEQSRTPKMSDLEVVSLALTAEYLSIDSECQLFRKIPESIKSKLKEVFLIVEEENYSLI